MKRTSLAVAAAVAGTLILSACAGNADPGSTGEAPVPETSVATDTAGTGEEISAEHNDADVMFAQMMIPHHQQAVEMSEILLAKDDIPQNVADFAQGVIDAQGPEIDRMNAMLEAWGQQPMNMDDMDGTGGMGGHGGMSGMMSEDDMQQLEDATGTDAAKLYLEQMTRHHEGAVDMAEQQVADGQNPQAVALAEQVIEDQEAEIQEMKTMLENL
ncbi:DUF305 domain-containing protein [Brevibacterium luteolum]|uniref:DUF305 domain-containing protein n=1 Tax=Brevibacterium luteolum TaxID=199591 RepID=A0A849AS88_9MICO|nr:DUF305 domain-containing protein [Brevibacterium luteolum]MBM7530323.1 uncharacterized protein (DUF305 family) [Brevibacterium luteolum]MCT1920990.1 DUF305 domain-containing protein [Brevibacterium luteolum]NNG80048.1 DUF305 domain-containing protein [Brevibacterium luteolum]